MPEQSPRLSNSPPSAAFVQSAYAQCARIALGLLSARGGLSPQLFLVGPPASGQDDAATSRMAHAGEQAVAALHADTAQADQLVQYIGQMIDPRHDQGRALARQLGSPVIAVHACHAIVPQGLELACPEGAQPVTRPDGRREALLVTVYTQDHRQSAWCALHRNADGALASDIAALDWAAPAA